jgi:hypothetical protein
MALCARTAICVNAHMFRDRCPGPTPEGGCSEATPEGLVRCAGRRVELTLADGTEAVWEVSEDASTCFLACLGAGVGLWPIGDRVGAVKAG